MMRRTEQRSWSRTALFFAVVISLLLLVSIPHGSSCGASCLFFTLVPLLFLGLLPLPADFPLPRATAKALLVSPEVHPRRLQLPPPVAR